jgi:purine-binding chemotaxis protein CheW
MSAPMEEQTASNRFLTFRIDEQLYALRSDEVAEVIRAPAVTRVPQGPVALLGLANLRGSVLPVAGLREMLGKKTATEFLTARAIVLDIGTPVAVVVDSVANLESITPRQIGTNQKEAGTEGSEKILGAFSVGSSKEVAKILDVKALLESAFSSLPRVKQRGRSVGAGARLESEGGELKKTEVLVTFEVAGQEFALPLEAVQEILSLPPALTAVARAEALVLGIASVRDTLMPLLSLRGLLGFAASQAANEREKVVVMKLHGAQIGLVADQARAIVTADLELMDAIPPVIAARTGGESRIRSIYRGEGGRRLISILSPEQMFREDVMRKLTSSHRADQAAAAPAAAPAGEELIVLIFRLGDDEFAIPIDAVVEVAQEPAQITRVPKTPKFLEGVVNLRGEVLPVVDQRRRFDLPKHVGNEARRLVVIKTERHRAGLIVDSVSDVLRIDREKVAPAPQLTDEKTSRLVRGVINLEKLNRMVLLLDPTELLTRAEQGLLDTFQAQSKKANA